MTGERIEQLYEEMTEICGHPLDRTEWQVMADFVTAEIKRELLRERQAKTQEDE